MSNQDYPDGPGWMHPEYYPAANPDDETTYGTAIHRQIQDWYAGTDPEPPGTPQEAPGPPQRPRWRTAVLIATGLAVVAVTAFVALRASSAMHGSPPPAAATATTTANDRDACRQLAAGVAAHEDSARGPNDPGTWYQLSAAVLAIQGKPAGTYSPGFRRDALAVIGDPAKAGSGLYEPGPGQVAALQDDCAALGVTGDAWPAELTARP